MRSTVGPIDAMDPLTPNPNRALQIISVPLSSTTKYERKKNKNSGFGRMRKRSCVKMIPPGIKNP